MNLYNKSTYQTAQHICANNNEKQYHSLCSFLRDMTIKVEVVENKHMWSCTKWNSICSNAYDMFIMPLFDIRRLLYNLNSLKFPVLLNGYNQNLFYSYRQIFLCKYHFNMMPWQNKHDKTHDLFKMQIQTGRVYVKEFPFNNIKTHKYLKFTIRFPITR